jgi:hypothetical protein
MRWRRGLCWKRRPMDKFVALPVRQGDAFYLERNDWSVLVDGGKNQATLPSLFKRYTNKSGVDVLACTHNDADHANGILGFLESDLSCKELWLPRQWLDGLHKVLAPVENVLGDLIQDIATIDDLKESTESDQSPLEAYAKSISEKLKNHSESHTVQLSEDGWSQAWQTNLERFDERGLDFLSSLAYPDYLCFYRLTHHALLLSAVSAAQRIRRIAQVAYHRSIKVCWFAFDPKNPSGGNQNLSPVNSREVVGSISTKPVKSTLAFLALSVVNKESLVFWSPGNNHSGGALFTADSDLANAKLPCLSDAIVTCPHHGSEDNAKAYQAIALSACAPAGLKWIRSDGRFQKRPGASYLGTSGQRFCTICRLGITGFTLKDAVELQGSSGGWHPTHANSKCQCS